MNALRIPFASLTLLLATTAGSGIDYEYRTACGAVDSTVPSTQPAVLLIGGAEADQPGELEATEWFIDQGGGGDYLVLRGSGTGSQADWVCQQFGGQISSASELSIDQRSAAERPEVLALIESAEMIFIAGGDQSEYRDLWRGTALAEALNDHMQTRPIAGTSAGMAILGSSYYAPESQSLLGSEILNDPFHPNTAGLDYEDFLRHPQLAGVITDTHLDRAHGPANENRYGRLFGLLARLRDRAGHQEVLIGIGAEEATLIAIDSGGTAHVFGTGSAYFLIANPAGPEQIAAQSPLIWNQGQQAARVYRVQGTPGGAGSVPLRRWQQASGGDWLNWFTSGGLSGFNAPDGSCMDCAAGGPPTWAQPLFGDRFQSPP